MYSFNFALERIKGLMVIIIFIDGIEANGTIVDRLVLMKSKGNEESIDSSLPFVSNDFAYNDSDT